MPAQKKKGRNKKATSKKKKTIRKKPAIELIHRKEYTPKPPKAGAAIKTLEEMTEDELAGYFKFLIAAGGK